MSKKQAIINEVESNTSVKENTAQTNENSEYYAIDSDKYLKNGKKIFLTTKNEGAVANFYDWIRSVLFAVVIVIFCLSFIFRLVDVKGTSMVSTLQNKDKVIVTNFCYTPDNGDIVVISHGVEYNEPIIKRVIATEGQTLKLDYENDRIIVDGVVLDEPYIDVSTFSGIYADYELPEVIPENKIFVLGDNRPVSKDSRCSEIGLVDVDAVIGKAQFILFPFSDFKYLYWLFKNFILNNYCIKLVSVL